MNALPDWLKLPLSEDVEAASMEPYRGRSEALASTLDVQHALDPQQLVAPDGAHAHQPAIEAVPVQRLVEGEAE